MTYEQLHEQLHALHVLASELMTGAAFTAAACFDEADDRELGDACAEACRASGSLVELLHARLWPDG